MKIIYIETGLELGENYPEYKEEMYRVWGHMSDENLLIFGLKRVEEKETDK